MSSTIDLDCANASRGVWLVKVPKYISQRWEKQKSYTEVGRLKIITNEASSKPDIFFKLSDDIIKADPTSTKTQAETSNSSSTSSSLALIKPNHRETASIPAEHKFVISDITHQTLAIFSQDENKTLALEGKVVQKGECRPIGDANYMKLKKESIRIASQPTKVVQKLDRAINNFKPINAHRSELDNEMRKRAEGKKMREDKDVVQNALFNAFEKHQYYNIKDLERITKQPVPYLKEILKEICNYNAKNPHKNMWELKPQFRHYKKDG